jgi:hypothetical protein
MPAEEASTSGSGIDWEAFQAQQRAAPRLSHADEARTLLDMGRHAAPICSFLCRQSPVLKP